MAKKFWAYGGILPEDSIGLGMVKLVYVDEDSRLYEAKEKDSKISGFTLMDASGKRIIEIPNKRVAEIGDFSKGSPVCLACVMRTKHGLITIAAAKNMAELGREVIKQVKAYHFDARFHEKFKNDIYKFFFEDITTDMILQFTSNLDEWQGAEAIDNYCELDEYYKSIILLYDSRDRCCAFVNKQKDYQFLVVILKDMALHIYSIKSNVDESITICPTKYYKCAGPDDEWKKFLDNYYKISDYDY